MFQNYTFIGNLTRDPESIKDGKYSKFSVAVNYGYGDNAGVVFWDVFIPSESTSKYVLGYLRKGSQVLVSGELTDNSYEKDGERVDKRQVVAREVKGLNRVATKEEGGSSESSGSTGDSEEEDDDIPF